ncbi:MAG: phage-shock protein [Candidatus Hydrogenedentota bacterium]
MWEEVAIVAVGCIGAVTIILSIGMSIYMIIRASRGGGPKKRQGEDIEETRLIQEIHHGLKKMDSRVEALETLLLDDDRRKKRDFDEELRKG